MEIGNKEAVEFLMEAGLGNNSLKVENKRVILQIGDSLINWMNKIENETVQPPEADLPEESE